MGRTHGSKNFKFYKYAVVHKESGDLKYFKTLKEISKEYRIGHSMLDARINMYTTKCEVPKKHKICTEYDFVRLPEPIPVEKIDVELVSPETETEEENE